MPTLPIRTATLSVHCPFRYLRWLERLRLLSKSRRPGLEHTDGKERMAPKGFPGGWAHGREGDGSNANGDGGSSQHRAGGERIAPDEAREAAFASLSRELRFCLDSDGCLTLRDGAWQATLGVEPAALLGAHWTTLVDAIDHAPMRVAIERALSLGDAQPEIELRMNAAAEAQPLVHWTLIPGPGGEAIVAVGYDRTAQHRAAAEARGEAARLQRRVEELEALVDDLGDHSRSMEGFAATVAHQLSEPLIVAESGTIMVAEELGDALDPDLRARLDAIGRGAARARQTIDALLMDARSGNGVELQPVSTERVVTQLLEELAPRMRERGVVADVGTLPAVRAERRLLAVVFQNLLPTPSSTGPATAGGSDRRRAPRGRLAPDRRERRRAAARGPDAADLRAVAPDPRRAPGPRLRPRASPSARAWSTASAARSASTRCPRATRSTSSCRPRRRQPVRRRCPAARCACGRRRRRRRRASARRACAGCSSRASGPSRARARARRRSRRWSSTPSAGR